MAEDERGLKKGCENSTRAGERRQGESATTLPDRPREGWRRNDHTGHTYSVSKTSGLTFIFHDAYQGSDKSGLDLTQSTGYTASQRQIPPTPPLNIKGTGPRRGNQQTAFCLKNSISRGQGSSGCRQVQIKLLMRRAQSSEGAAKALRAQGPLWHSGSAPHRARSVLITVACLPEGRPTQKQHAPPGGMRTVATETQAQSLHLSHSQVFRYFNASRP